jgi:hypothetical protein
MGISKAISSAALLVLALLYGAACGNGSGGAGGSGGSGGSSGGGASGALGDVPSCSGDASQGVFQVQGTLDGQTDLPIGLTIDDAAVDTDPGSVQLHLTWTGLVANGESAATTGTITLPTGDPYPQMSLCAGSGSQIEPNDNGLAFVLQGLTLGPACTQAVTGELRGCWASRPN